jgi:hypothetical protein
VGLNIGSTTNLAIKSHTSIANVGDGMYLSSCVAVTVGDSLISNNQGNGLNIDDQSQVTASDFLIEGTVFSENLFRGIDIKATTLANIIDVVIKDSTLQSNGLGGINCSFVDNVIISGCDAQSNGGDAFHIFGVNNGNNPFDTPANPQGNVGRSPFLIEGCAAIENTGHGFYSSNVGGVLVRDSFASYNGGLGFWYDNGSWNAQVENCTALSNGNVGFMTWDATAVATSFYKNRYRDCYGGQNSTASVFDPFGGGDFAQGNIQFNNMVTPLAAIYPSSVLGTPEIALFGTVSPIFCIFE